LHTAEAIKQKSYGETQSQNIPFETHFY